MSEKIRGKLAILVLPRNNYQAWIERIAEVAAIMEDNEKFVKKGEAQTTQFPSRSRTLQSECLTTTVQNNLPNEPAYGAIDQDGDTVVGGMKLDSNSLATLIARIGDRGSETNNEGGQRPKILAPWRTEKGVADLCERNLCLRCKNSSHIARYCRTFGPQSAQSR